MKFHTEYLIFRTKTHREYINVTTQVQSALSNSSIREGMILVSAMHITAGVWVNDAEDGLIADIDEWLEKLRTHRTQFGAISRSSTWARAALVREPSSRAMRRIAVQGTRLNRVTLRTGP